MQQSSTMSTKGGLTMADIIRILDLPVKKEWYQMIESGEKPEEYRKIKPYWVKRLVPCTKECANGTWLDILRFVNCRLSCKALDGHMNYYHNGKRIGPFTHVRFRYGYTRRTMLFEIDEVKIGRGKTEWGAPKHEEVFIIKFH